uniref:Ig-like domain-containing protein n=1 Tax=Eptatretus burgeri TaxID=7764 RepID=A0A8C4N3M3_EPTBU
MFSTMGYFLLLLLVIDYVSGHTSNSIEKLTVAEGQTAKMDCVGQRSFSQHDSFRWKWIPDSPTCNVHMEPHKKFHGRMLHRWEPPTLCMLELRNLSWSDSGKLHLIVNGIQRNVHLMVKRACDSFPWIRADPPGPADDETDVRLLCEAPQANHDSTSRRGTHWTFNGKALPTGVSRKGDGSTLLIQAPHTKHFGLYVCSLGRPGTRSAEFCFSFVGSSNEEEDCINVTRKARPKAHLPPAPRNNYHDIKKATTHMIVYVAVAAVSLLLAVIVTAYVVLRRNRRNLRNRATEPNKDNAYESMQREMAAGRVPATDGQNPIYENIDSVMKGNSKKTGDHDLSVYEIMKHSSHQDVGLGTGPSLFHVQNTTNPTCDDVTTFIIDEQL